MPSRSRPRIRSAAGRHTHVCAFHTRVRGRDRQVVALPLP